MTAHTDPTGQTAPIVPGDLFARHQTIAGLRALADFLEANPALPVDEYGEFYNVFTRDCDDSSAVALVDQTAALLGVEIIDRRSLGGHYAAKRTFGRITYAVVHIPERQKRESRARDSYCRNIVLDPDQDNGDQDDRGRAA
ncbi:hypothetical protein [Actinomadura madurae]|uniref:hypothetical protein n=1 Tax=Actinomadura madurae TaxID=1993 RepID=UPI0020D251C0|nr:hypothetical protein [Actinomadura madurae]MCP9951687.1 hypothetical protein [Actinomadura madurae]MCP9968459.1 hypothetical protein [Actinomadura madurae]MCP9980931.1 hypothetical protein [Actinomadura madurae]MCQ0007568.1 hypothetical protein [Actinomadura madurae]MCQ0017125.1 hypothetical protein [Actinomadura madurae]